MHCAICNDKISSEPIMWQPFGPDESVWLIIRPGYHYRGFPIVKVCFKCCKDVQQGLPIEFTYKKQRYFARDNEVREIPEYINDALAWSEDWE